MSDFAIFVVEIAKKKQSSEEEEEVFDCLRKLRKTESDGETKG